MKTLVFGADGGGTKTIGIISDGGNVIAKRSVGASNPNVVGFDAAANRLYELIVSCCGDAGCKPTDVQSLVLGIAGVGRQDIRNALSDKIVNLAGNELPLVIDTDARIAIEGAFNGGPGVVIIAGTGSIVIGKSSGGEIVVAGGWGRILGDEGSGYWLGREALKSVAQWLDGRGGSEHLAKLVAKELGLQNRDELIAAVYQNECDVAGVASLLIGAAEEGDTYSLEILHRGAEELTLQAELVFHRLHQDAVMPVALLGGAIERPLYASIARSAIEKRIKNARIQPPLSSAVHGAVLMAAKLAMS